MIACFFITLKSLHVYGERSKNVETQINSARILPFKVNRDKTFWKRTSGKNNGVNFCFKTYTLFWNLDPRPSLYDIFVKAKAETLQYERPFLLCYHCDTLSRSLNVGNKKSFMQRKGKYAMGSILCFKSVLQLSTRSISLEKRLSIKVRAKGL
jgi:hypothetical protein